MTAQGLATVRVVGLRSGRSSELFAETLAPPLSWRTETSTDGWLQAWAVIELSTEGETRLVTLQGRDSVLVDWPFGELRPLERATVKVRVGGSDGSQSGWSDELVIVGPDIDFGDRESFITLASDAAADADVAAQFRTFLALDQRPRRATLTFTGHGVHEAFLNGVKVGDEWLAPGWSAYDRRLVYRSHDVTPMVAKGDNVLGFDVAPGWFGERFGFFGRTARGHQGPLTIIARLTCEYPDGSTITVHSGPEWQSRIGGPVTAASIYHGESHDSRLRTRWSDPGTGWEPSSAVALPGSILEAASASPVRVTEVRTPELIWVTPQGHTLVDFGENCVGVTEITVQGPPGHRVELRHCEELEHGEPAYGPLRTAKATDSYTLAGDGPESWHPRFTFHGFRYLELINWPGEIRSTDIRMLVLHSDQRRIGTFECSNPLITQLFANTVRSWRGNSLAVPTDCPQRDERLGWTGDLQVFVPAASSMFDVGGFLASWLRDVSVEQEAAHGSVPVIVPAVMSGHDHPVAGWGDVATVAPWTLYERFGDRTLLARQFPSMRGWVDCVLDAADDDLLWTTGLQIGDHLAPHASSFFPGAAPTDTRLIASLYLWRSLGIVTDAARVLGDERAAQHYGALHTRCRDSLVAEYITPRGRTVSDSISSYAMLIAFGVVGERSMIDAMGRRLAELIGELDFRIGTGFLGTPLVMDALSASGQLDTAARLITQTSCPSWLYPVTQGATTIWERWDTKLPDGRVSSEDMASFNHYALGAVTDWLQRGLAGLDLMEPGYRKIRIAPVLLPGFAWASTTIDTPYGKAAASWQLSDGRVTVQAVIPPNTTAVVALPDGTRRDDVGSGSHEWTCDVPCDDLVRGAVSLDTTLDALVRDDEARRAIMSALELHDPQRAAAFGATFRWTPGVPLHAALMFADPRAIAEIDRALTNLTGLRSRDHQNREGDNT